MQKASHVLVSSLLMVIANFTANYAEAKQFVLDGNKVALTLTKAIHVVAYRSQPDPNSLGTITSESEDLKRRAFVAFSENVPRAVEAECKDLAAKVMILNASLPASKFASLTITGTLKTGYYDGLPDGGSGSEFLFIGNFETVTACTMNVLPHTSVSRRYPEFITFQKP